MSRKKLDLGHARVDVIDDRLAVYAGPLSAFGELITVEPTSLVQLLFTASLNTRLVSARTNNGGAVSQDEHMAKVSSGTNTNSRGQLFSKTPIKYNPGQGGSVKFTALFESAGAGSEQVVGVGDISDGYFFGYDGADFGVLRRKGGHPEVQTLTVTNDADTSSGDITITLDGDAKVIAVALNDTSREVAVKIADTDFSQVGEGWDANVHNATVIFRSYSAGNKSGTFSFADTDTTGVVASIAETVAGETLFEKWVAQSAWSEDRADGTGALPEMDFTKGQVFNIRYQWLGFGPIFWILKNPENDDFVVVHKEQYTNSNTTTSTDEPTLPLCVEAKNTSGTTDRIIRIGSMGGFADGKAKLTGFHNSDAAADITISTTEKPLISIKNNLIYNSHINRVSLFPGFIDLQTDAAKPVIFRLRVNGGLTGPVAFTDVDTANSIASVDKAATGIDNGNVIETLVLGKIDSKHIDLHILNGKVFPGDIITITAQAAGGGTSASSASMTWAEQF